VHYRLSGRRNCENLWKPTIGALGLVRGVHDARRPYDVADDRITDICFTRSIDDALGWIFEPVRASPGARAGLLIPSPWWCCPTGRKCSDCGRATVVRSPSLRDPRLQRPLRSKPLDQRGVLQMFALPIVECDFPSRVFSSSGVDSSGQRRRCLTRHRPCGTDCTIARVWAPGCLGSAQAEQLRVGDSPCALRHAS